MEYPVMLAQQRDRIGKGGARTLRRNGWIPAICYSEGTEPINLQLKPDDILTVLKKTELGENSVIRLQFEGEVFPEQMVMIKDLQRHPLSRSLMHADLFRLDMSKKIKVWVPLVFTGRSKGVVAGGIMQIVRRELEIECLPGNIPTQIEYDITELDLGDAAHISDIELPEGLRAVEEGRYTIATVVAPTSDAEESEEGEEGEESSEETSA